MTITWREFKELLEKNGVTDDMIITWIDYTDGQTKQREGDDIVIECGDGKFSVY